MTPLEKAARALLASESNGEKQWDELDAITRGAFLRDARAVLQALREPSEGMVAAADNSDALRWSAPGGLDFADWRKAWTFMIDAALSE